MGRFPDLDFMADVKRSRKNRKYEHQVVEKIRELSDSKWWWFDESNIFGGTSVHFNTNSEVKLFPVILSLHQDLYHIQFATKNDGLTYRALKTDHKNNIENLMKHANSFNVLHFNGEMPNKIKLRLSSKQYLKFLNNIEKETVNFLESIEVESSLENKCLALSLSFLCNSYTKYYNLDYTEEELIVEFFKRFNHGLTPEVALATICSDVSFNECLKYSGIPGIWVEKSTGLNCKIA